MPNRCLPAATRCTTCGTVAAEFVCHCCKTDKREPARTAPQARFNILNFQDQVTEGDISLDDLQAANEHDDDLCAWARWATVGARECFGHAVVERSA